MNLKPAFAAGSIGSGSTVRSSIGSQALPRAQALARRIPWLVFAAFLVLHPLNAELILATPAIFLAEALIAVGGLLVLLSDSRNRIALGTAMLCAAAFVAPLVAWPAFLIPLIRRDLGLKRVLAGASVLGLAGLALDLFADLSPGFAELIRDPVGKGLEVAGLLQSAIWSALLPFTTPHLGTTRDALPVVGAILVGLAAPFLALRAVCGVRITRRWEGVAVLGAVAVLAPILPTLLGMPHLSTGALLVWVALFIACQAVGWAFGRLARVGMRRALAASAIALTLVSLGLTNRHARAAFGTWSDESSAWSALLAEDPLSQYRWEYSEFLRERGDFEGARREAIRYLKLDGVPPERRLGYALLLVADGIEDDAFEILSSLGGRVQPSREDQVRSLLSLYEKRSAWLLYFGIPDSTISQFPELRLAVAKTARRLERRDLARHHLDVLLAAERPTFAAFEFAYRGLVASQDIDGLNALGDRAIDLYPDAYVGYAARGKAAKIVRKDEEMIRWHEEALRHGTEPWDLHWDLGLVYHGRRETAKLALEHYERLLEIAPDHAQRRTIEVWIAGLAEAIKSDVAPEPPPLVDDPSIFADFGHQLEQVVYLPGGDQKTADPVLPATGDVRIQKPDFSVPSVGFPFAFWRCYRSGVTYNGPLGQNWDFNFNMHMMLSSDGQTITSYDGTARQDIYTNASGVWEPPAGRYDRITYDSGSGTYTRTEADGFKYIYTAHVFGLVTYMRLSKWKDLNDNEMTFTYSGTGVLDKLTGITDTSGNSYVLTYTNNLLTELRDNASTNRKIGYAYDSNGDLTLVTELIGESSLLRKTSYTYRANHLVKTITDGKENAKHDLDSNYTAKPFCRNYYDGSSKKLLVQEYGPDAESESTPNPPTSHAFIYAYSTGYTTFTDREGTVIKFEYDSSDRITGKEWQQGGTPRMAYAYDAQNQITRITKDNGARISYVYDAKGNVLTSKTTDSSGNNALTSIFGYESTYNRLTSATDPAGVANVFTYDGRANLITARSASGTLDLTTIYHYDNANKYLLDQVTDPKGLVTAYEYNTAWRLTKVRREPSGLNLTVAQYAYDEFGNVTASTDGKGNQTTFVVNRLNQVTEIDAPSPLGYYTKFFYDGSDNVVTTKVQNGTGQGSGDFETAMEYDLLDNLTKSTVDVAASTTAITQYYYDLDDKLTKVTAPEGNETKWVYNDFDLNTEITVAYGAGSGIPGTYKYFYDDNFRLVKIEEPLGSTYKTEFEYDHHDRTTKVKNANSHYATSTFTNHLLTASESYVSGGGTLLAKTTYAYDAGNRLTKSEVMAKNRSGSNLGAGDGWVTSTLVYDANSNVVTTKDEGDNETHFTFDTANRLSIVEDAIGSYVAFVYDANSNVVTKTHYEKQDGVSGFDEFQYRFAYDNLNRLTKTYDPASKEHTFTYDARNLVTTQDPLGNKRYMYYDELNRTIRLDVEYSGSNVLTTKWAYDKNSRLTKLTDAKNYDTTYTYDARDRLSTETYPDTYSRIFTYDVNSNILTAKDQNNTQVFYAYDLLNRLTQKTYSLGAAHIHGEATATNFAYDALNRLTQADDTDSKVILSYNTLGAVEREEERYGSGNLGSTGKIVDCNYDSQGRLSQCSYPGANSTDGDLTYAYDSLNRLTKTQRAVSSTATDLCTWTFKGPSRVIKKEYGNGTWVDVTYDSRAQVSSVVHWKPDEDSDTIPEHILECVYTYDDEGKVKSEAIIHYMDDGQTSGVRDRGFTYAYDKAYRLTKLYRGVPSGDVGSDPPSTYAKKVEYTFDANSNRQTVAFTPQGSSTTNHIYTPNSTNSYTTVNWGGTSETFAYDKTGNRTQSGGGAKAWYYDYQNHLVEVMVDNAHFVQYDYDALGRRSEKRYLYDGLDANAVKRFYYAGSALIQEVDVSAGENGAALDVEYFWGQSAAEPIYIRAYDVADPGTLIKDGFYHQNQYGSVYALTHTDTPVKLIETYRYTEYGEALVYGGDTTTEAPTIGNKWAWQCHYYDFEVTNFESGQALYGDGAVAYDPEMGASISRLGRDSNARQTVSPSDRAGDVGDVGGSGAAASGGSAGYGLAGARSSAVGMTQRGVFSGHSTKGILGLDDTGNHVKGGRGSYFDGHISQFGAIVGVSDAPAWMADNIFRGTQMRGTKRRLPIRYKIWASIGPGAAPPSSNGGPSVSEVPSSLGGPPKPKYVHTIRRNGWIYEEDDDGHPIRSYVDDTTPNPQLDGLTRAERALRQIGDEWNASSMGPPKRPWGNGDGGFMDGRYGGSGPIRPPNVALAATIQVFGPMLLTVSTALSAFGLTALAEAASATSSGVFVFNTGGRAAWKVAEDIMIETGATGIGGTVYGAATTAGIMSSGAGSTAFATMAETIGGTALLVVGPNGVRAASDWATYEAPIVMAQASNFSRIIQISVSEAGQYLSHAVLR